MKVTNVRIPSIILLFIAVIVGVIGCAQIRELTYPQDFVYMEKAEVEGMMQNMSASLVTLDHLVAEASKTDTVQQDKIIAKLSEIEKIAIRLSGGHKQTNQFVISDHIEQFITDIGMAKMLARNSPPNYYKASEITNSCLACHDYR